MDKRGWKYKKLGEVATFVNGFAFKPEEWAESGTPIIRIQNLNNPDAPYNYYAKDIAEKYVVNKGDLLISWSASLGAYIWEGERSYLNQHIFKVQFDKSDILKMYLKYAVTAKIDEMLNFVHGATMKHIVKKDFDNTIIPTPSLTTQSSIVAELDKINHIISQKKEQIKDLDKLAQSLFYEMFGDPKETKFEKKSLLDLSKKIGDGLHGTPIYEDDSQYYFINGNNLREGIIVCDALTKKVGEAEYKKNYIAFDHNTILISINGTIGNRAFYNDEKIILGKSACYIMLKEDVDKRYVYSLLGSPYFYSYVGNEMTGSTIKNVSLKSMRTFPVPVPPLALQHSFAAKIEAIEAHKTAVQASIADLQTLLDARMQEYFG